MEALVELLVAILTFIFEVTVHAIVFLFHLVMAVFSRRYREQLREDWNTSIWNRCGMMLGVAMYSAALVMALLFWTPPLCRGTPVANETGRKAAVTIEFSGKQVKEMEPRGKIGALLDSAGEAIKRKLAERKQEEQKDPP